MLTPEEKEMLRHAVLDVLALRHPAALRLAAVRRETQRECGFPAADPELESALAVLEDLSLVKKHLDPLGSGACYQATAAGLLANERR